MTIKYPVVLGRDDGGTLAWPDDLPLPPGTENGERRFEVESRGLWRMISRVRGLAITTRLVEKGPIDSLNVYEYTAHGDRNLNGCRESGYQQEGRVSLGGSNRSAFTGSILVMHRGKPYSMSVLYCRARGPALACLA